MLIAQKQIRGLQTFTTKYDINRWNLVSLKQDPDIRVLKPEYIAILVKNFGVSAEWVITGRGGMFTK